MHCDLPGDIPDTYIETAQFDCLHDEGILYAQKLKEAGAYVEVTIRKELITDMTPPLTRRSYRIRSRSGWHF